jgi:DNA-binding GntR family transcriptional regulator
VRNALDMMAMAARTEDRAALVKSAFEFHIGLVGLAGHKRLEDGYRALWLQMHLFMAVDTRLREQLNETLEENVARHRRLLALVEAGDREAVMAELESHGDRAFFEEMTQGIEDASARA